MSAEVIQNGKSTLNVDSIQMRQELMFREKLDEDRIEQYQERYENGFYMDPVKVYSVKDEGRLLVDGFHRLTAAKKAGCEQINAVLEYGSYEDAEWAAANANLTHGKALSREERKKVAVLYLKRYPQRSDSWIADDVGISDKTVRGLREELESTSEIPKLNELVGKDGKQRPRTRKPSRKSEQKSDNQKLKVELENSDKKEKIDSSELDKKEAGENDLGKKEKLPGQDLPGEENPAEKMVRAVQEEAKTAKDLKITEWDDDGNKIVKDRDGNVIEYVKGDRPPKKEKKTPPKASSSSKPQSSGRKDYHKINWYGLIDEVVKEHETIDELINEGCHFFSIDNVKDPFLKAWIIVLNMSYERLLWDDDEYEDTLELEGKKFAIKIKELKNNEDSQADEDIDGVDDDLYGSDLDDEFDFVDI